MGFHYPKGSKIIHLINNQLPNYCLNSWFLQEDAQDLVLSRQRKTNIVWYHLIWNLQKSNSEKQKVQWWLPGGGS